MNLEFREMTPNDADEVAEIGNAVVALVCHEIEVVACGFALQHVASVNEDGPHGVMLALLCNKPMHPLQTSFPPAVVPEVIGKVVAVDVCREDDFYFALPGVQ